LVWVTKKCELICVCFSVCVYVYVWEREKERECSVSILHLVCNVAYPYFLCYISFFAKKATNSSAYIKKTAEKEIHLFSPLSVLYVFGCLTKSNKGSRIKMLIRYCLFMVLTPMVFTFVKELRAFKESKKDISKRTES